MNNIPVFSKQVMDLLEKRYLRGESVPEMFTRVAHTIASAERPILQPYYEDAYMRMLTNLDFLPNSPALMNAGRELGQMAACFVLPVQDSIEGIFDALKWTALVHKSGGGTGFDFSELRPMNSIVGSTQGVASGPISFMRIFNAATEEVKQGGARRGANMGILRVDHPDILEFIACKEVQGVLTNFNLSIAMTDKFMDAYENDETYELNWGGKVYGELRARDVMNAIIYQAWLHGGPGVIFIDKMNADNPFAPYKLYYATNPCGEQPLPVFGSCDLGSINLMNFVVEDGQMFDWERLGEVVYLAVTFLDNILDLNKYPLPQIKEEALSARRIGLGVMGWSDALFKLGIPYDSEEAIILADRLMRFISHRASYASMEIAKEKGRFPDHAKVKGHVADQRNATLTTIAPTGSISMIAGVSSGIEPSFGLVAAKEIMMEKDGSGNIYYTKNQIFIDALRAEGYSDEVIRDMIQEVAESGSCQNVPFLDQKIKNVFKINTDIAMEWHIRMQAAFQKHVDNAVSKTIMLPNNATEAQVLDAYLLAYKLGCKGLTIYRNGSLDSAVYVNPKDALKDCPECGSKLSHGEGCVSCPNCGWGLCS